MITAYVIQMVQLGQNGTKSANMELFLVFANFDRANVGVPNSLFI